MKLRLRPYIISAFAIALAAVSCSTTRILSEDEYSLLKNNIEVTNSKSFNTNLLHQYIKQSPSSGSILGWNPFQSVYNWADADDESTWGKLCHKLGSAPVIYDPEAVENSIESMKNHLEYLGYYNSDVVSDIKVANKKVKVDYLITLGKQYRIDSISYVLPERGPFKEDFKSDLANFSVKEGDYLSESALEAETQRGAAYFRQLGYYTFSKNYYLFEADTVSVPGRVSLEMTINEFTRNESESNAAPIRKFYIDSVTINYPKDIKIKEKTIRDFNTIRPGDLYSESNINNAYSRLSALRMFNGVSIGMTQSDTNKVNCAINLSQSKLQGFKMNLEASTNNTGLMGVSPQLSFFNKNVFHGGEWLNLSFMGNFQFKFNDPARSNEFGVSAGLSLPRFLGIPNSAFKGASIPRTEINVSYNYQDRPEYTRNIISTSLGFSGVYQKLSYQIYPAQISIVHLDNMDEEFFRNLSKNPFMKYAYQDHFDSGIGGTIQYNSNQNANTSGSHHYIRLSSDVSGNLLSLMNGLMKTDENGSHVIWGIPYSQYIRTELTLGKTWKFGKNYDQAIATRVLSGVGHAYGNSSVLPFEKQFYSGGANSMRGWQARSLGPGQSPMNESFIIPSQTGDMKFEANLEYRFNMFWKLEGALFVDAGNIWTLHQDDQMSSFSFSNLGDSIAADWGTGIRVNMNFLVLRVDLGMKLHDPSREVKWLSPDKWLKRDGYAVHFGVGYPF